MTYKINKRGGADRLIFNKITYLSNSLDTINGGGQLFSCTFLRRLPKGGQSVLGDIDG